MMMRLVIRDYFAAFRWQNVKEVYKKGIWWIFLDFLIFVPCINQIVTSEVEMTAYLLVMIPMLFCELTEPLHSPVLPKMMHLCPMSKELRREYVVKARFVRIAVPLIIGCLGVAGLLIWGICDWICAVGVLVNISTFSVFIGAGLNANGSGKISGSGTVNTNNSILETFIIMVSFIVALLYGFWLCDMTDILWLEWCCTGITIGVQLPMLIAYLKRWEESIEQTICYESSHVTKKEQRTGR